MINDMKQTLEQVVRASGMPLSIIIVSIDVGDEMQSQNNVHGHLFLHRLELEMQTLTRWTALMATMAFSEV